MRHCLSLILLTYALQLEGLKPENKSADPVEQPLGCIHPEGKIGESEVIRCTEYVCTQTGEQAHWKESFARNHCCSYQQVSYHIGDTMASILAQDNRTVVTMVCAVDDNGQSEVQMKTNNNCAKTIKEKLDEHANIVEDVLKEQNLEIEDVTAKLDSLEQALNKNGNITDYMWKEQNSKIDRINAKLKLLLIQNHEQCRAPYSTISDSWRKIGYSSIPYNPTNLELNCDKNLTTGWYRFQDPAGQTLPIAPPPEYGPNKKQHCDTHGTGWIKEGRQPVFDGQIMVITICIAWSNECSLSIPGKAVACKDDSGSLFYLYYLKKPSTGCSYAYCVL